MASSSPNRALAARSSAVLTTGEVAASALDLNEAWGSNVNVHVEFTLGMLTNVVLRFYVSADGTNWKQIHAPGSTVAAMVSTLTASASINIPVPALAGWKHFRVTAQGTGTVTNSLLALTYRYLRRASQG